jgi:hypothetical protein
VHEVDLEFFYLNILIIVFPCGFKDFNGIYQFLNEGVSLLIMIVEGVM